MAAANSGSVGRGKVNAEILPCPFCGESKTAFVEGSSFRWRLIECVECAAKGPEICIQTVPDHGEVVDHEKWEEKAFKVAIEEWNKRSEGGNE